MTADEIIERLGLVPLEMEGGFFRETYRCDEGAAAEALPARYGGPRCFATAIYYLLTPRTHSQLHRLASDEIFHFLLGDAVIMLHLQPDGISRVVTLGSDLAAGRQLQVVVPRGVWQGCLLAGGGAWALMGVTVAPGFEYADYEAPDVERLIRQYPDREELIRRLA